MNPDARLQVAAGAAAEEILRTIYGDDLTGCTVSVDAITSIVLNALKEATDDQQQLLHLHEKAVEAFGLLSTPPAFAEMPTPERLRELLSERLDKIHVLTQRLTETAAKINSPQSED
jgi:hypothetical protein